MPDIILYKFRPLKNEKDCKRLKKILQDNQFWCTQFSFMNDPMEGVYLGKFNQKNIDTIFDQKNCYKFCSFSGDKGFQNPALWGYYANGFKGVAIAVKVNQPSTELIEISYKKNVVKYQDVKKILTTKLSAWKHEYEWRFLIHSDNSYTGEYYKIGKIVGIYFGNPYGNLNNFDQILDNNSDLIKYNKNKKKLKKFCNSLNLPCKDVIVEQGKIIICSN